MKEKITALLEQYKQLNIVARELNIHPKTLTKRCRELGIDYLLYIKDIDSYIGKTIGRLVVEKYEKQFYYCKCLNCNNNNFRINKYNLLNAGEFFCCDKCRIRHNFNGYKELTGHQFSRWRTGAKRRKILFDIKPEDVWNIYEKHNYICPILEEKLILENLNPKYNIKSNMSVDRINNQEHYHPKNIWCVHIDFNKFHHICKLEYVFYLSKLICNPLIQKGYQITDIPKWYLSQINNGADLRKMKFNLDKNCLLNQFNKQNGLCYYTGQLLHFADGQKQQKLQTASLDRLDNSKGYTIDNIVWCHKHINMMKKDLTVERFNFIAKMSVKNLPKLITIPQNEYILTGWENKKVSQEARDKMSKANKGKIVSEETKRKQSLSHKGYKVKESTKQKLAQVRKGQRLPDSAYQKSRETNAKTYYFLSPNNELVKIVNMSQFCKLNNLSSIQMCIVNQGKQKHHKGWRKCEQSNI